MSTTTLGQQGVEAVRNRKFAEALPLLDKALESSNAPGWLLARSQAHAQLKNFDLALRDAELAYHTAAERGSGNSRKLMIEAQYRRALVYFKLGRYADADCCSRWAMLLAEGRPVGEQDGTEKQIDENGRYTVTYADGVADKKGQPGIAATAQLAAIAVTGGTPKTGFEADWNRAYAFRSQTLGILARQPPDHHGWKVSVSKIPPKPQKKAPIAGKTSAPESDSDNDVPTAGVKKIKLDAPEPGSVPEEKLKLRADFYQSSQNVTISLFAKDIKKEDIQVQLGTHEVQISPLPRDAAPYVKPGDREATSTFILGGEIVPSGSRWSATPRKIELVLQKAAPGVKWGRWGEEKIGPGSLGPSNDAAEAATESEATAASPEPPAAPAASSSTAEAKTAAPAYPTSSKSGPKNWDSMLEDEDDADKQDVNAFFKTLYKGATPEQQRAMMKSFIESNGTALSTDWDDVKSRKVDTIPPEGVEAKKWDS